MYLKKNGIAHVVDVSFVTKVISPPTVKCIQRKQLSTVINAVKNVSLALFSSVCSQNML